jgi:methylmalonyl-CoA/ethylmalonyl-CoA epimerase
MTTELSLHHVVFAVARKRLDAMTKLFTDLGLGFNAAELTELGIGVRLDWDRGGELISPLPGSSAKVAASVNAFLESNGDGVYTVVIRVPDTAAAESATARYGSAARFRQSFSGEGTYLDEIDLSVLGLPLTLLSTNVP